MSERDEELRNHWHAFCEELKGAGELLFRDTTPKDEVTRATGLRLLARNIALGLQFELENTDSRHPELLHYFDPLRKQGGDNTDALYVGAPVNGQDSYRITGHRGNARFFAVTVLEDGDTPWGGKVVQTLLGNELVVADDGQFEILLSPQVKPADYTGNWMQTSPDSYRVTVRQFFADWLREEPMRAAIECLGEAPPPPPPSSSSIAKQLGSAARWVKWSTHYWAEQLDKWQQQPETFLAYNELDKNSIDATPGGLPLIAYWQLEAHEAVIVRVTPPRAEYWAVEFGNYWWETMDYRYRLSNTNCHYAVLEESGELIVVIAHEDPGLPNWMDCSGYPQGYITYRWIGAEAYPRPHCKKVPFEQLRSHLPESVKNITAEQRRQQLRERRQGVINRFGA